MTSRMAEPGAQVREEAAHWFVDFRVGDISEAEQARFDRWLRRSPEHIQAYLEVAGTWSELPAAKPAIDLAALVAQARRHANIVPLAGAASRQTAQARPSRRPYLALAASVAILCAAAAWYRAGRDVEYLTGIGEQRSLTLADGSTVQLNTRTRIAVRITAGARQIDLLEGQALFSVAADAARPFVVDTGATRVTVIGTQFDVYRKPSEVLVTVVEGRVSVGEGAVLAAGEQAAITSSSVQRSVAADISAATAWTQRRLVFNATPLSEVVAEFNRYNIRRLTVTGAALGALRISGTYQSTDPASLLNFLRDDPSIAIARTNHEVRISRR